MSKPIQDCYVVAANRTPVGKAPRGVFKNTRPDDLLAHSLRGILDPLPQLDRTRIDDIIVGCAMPEAEQGMNVARIGMLLAGLPNSIGAMTINRFCSSGVQAVALAADRIRLGEADLMIGAGTESMSMIPMMGHKIAMNPAVFRNENIAIAYGMGITAEKVAEQWKVTREAQDQFALASHQKAAAAIAAGEFNDEILPYEIDDRLPDLDKRDVRVVRKTIRQDEGPRADTTLEALGGLKTVFRAGGSVTAGNSSQMSDGAGAVLLASEKAIKEFDLTPLARFVSFAVAGVKPDIMGIGPIAAIPKALKQAGLSTGRTRLDRTERSLRRAGVGGDPRPGKLDPAKVNPLGGAIALGHPLGATGAIRVGHPAAWAHAGASRSTAWSPCASAPAWAPRRV
jgi:acetyl-CoA acyltransferase